MSAKIIGRLIFLCILISFVCEYTIFESRWLYFPHVCKCKNAQINSVKLPASFAIERSVKASVEAWIKRGKNRRKNGKSKKRETSRARGRKEWSRRSRGGIRLRGQGLCLRVISCKNPINFLNPSPVAKEVANKRAY